MYIYNKSNIYIIMSSRHKTSNKARNYTTGEQRQVDKAENVINFPNVLTSNIYIDSDDKLSGGSYIDSYYVNKNNIVTSQVSRVGLKFIDMFYKIPNSNNRNNRYTVMVVGSAVEVSFTLPVRNYETATDLFSNDLITGFKRVMNDAIFDDTAIVAGIDFIEENNTGVWKMTSDVGFKFLTCNGITFGNNLHGIGYTAGFTEEIRILPKLYYTRYIDILFTEIIDAKVLSHKFSESKRFNTSNHLTRLYIPFAENGKQLTDFQRENININYYPYRHRDVSDIQISLVDEFQEPLYMETQPITTTNPITNINAEIPYLKYNLVLSIIG